MNDSDRSAEFSYGSPPINDGGTVLAEPDEPETSAGEDTDSCPIALAEYEPVKDDAMSPIQELTLLIGPLSAVPLTDAERQRLNEQAAFGLSAQELDEEAVQMKIDRLYSGLTILYERREGDVIVHAAGDPLADEAFGAQLRTFCADADDSTTLRCRHVLPTSV